MKIQHLIETERRHVELTQIPPPSRGDISDAWPTNVTYRGHRIFDVIYNSSLVRQLEAILKRSNPSDFESQESYLGYSPRKDVFVMGWDTWSDRAHTMNALKFSLDRDQGTLDPTLIKPVRFQGKFMYPEGHKELQKLFPDLIDIRLD